MVAKSFQKFQVIGDPYKKNGKMYVKVEKPDHTQKEVRYYTPVEYAKMYGEPIQSPHVKTLPELLGFYDGRITIFDGYIEEDAEFMSYKGCTFHRMWGWSLAGDKPIFKLPAHITAHDLYWDDVCDDTKLHLRAEESVIKIVKEIKRSR